MAQEGRVLLCITRRIKTYKKSVTLYHEPLPCIMFKIPPRVWGSTPRVLQLGAPSLNVSYKPQKISPKFEGTVRQLLHKRIRDAYIHPQVCRRYRNVLRKLLIIFFAEYFGHRILTGRHKNGACRLSGYKMMHLFELRRSNSSKIKPKIIYIFKLFFFFKLGRNRVLLVRFSS